MRPKKEFATDDVRSRRGQRFEETLKREEREKAIAADPATLSRRAFLKGSGTVIASIGLAAGLGWGGVEILRKYKTLEGLLAGSREEIDQYDYDEVVQQAKAYLKERYAATLVVGDDKDLPDITGGKVTLDKYKTSIRALIGELEKYPPEMIMEIGAGRGFEFRIMHEVELPYASSDNPLFSSTTKERAGGVAPGLRDGKPAQAIIDSSADESYQRQTVHHEINHRATAKWQNPAERDKKWSNLHIGIAGNPYIKRPPGGHKEGTPLPKHFLNFHASWRPVEDQAVCAEYMLTPALHVDFLKKIRDERDPTIKQILTAKYNTVKSEYLAWSRGRINEEFWNNIIRQGFNEARSVS